MSADTTTIRLRFAAWYGVSGRRLRARPRAGAAAARLAAYQARRLARLEGRVFVPETVDVAAPNGWFPEDDLHAVRVEGWAYLPNYTYLHDHLPEEAPPMTIDSILMRVLAENETNQRLKRLEERVQESLNYEGQAFVARYNDRLISLECAQRSLHERVHHLEGKVLTVEPDTFSVNVAAIARELGGLADWQRKVLDRWYGFTATTDEVHLNETGPWLPELVWRRAFRPYDWAMDESSEPLYPGAGCMATMPPQRDVWTGGAVYCDEADGHPMEHRHTFGDGSLVVWVGGHVEFYPAAPPPDPGVMEASERCGAWYGVLGTIVAVAAAAAIGTVLGALLT